METDGVPVVMALRRLVKYTAAGQAYEVIEWRDGKSVTFTPASEEWPRIVAALRAEE